MKAKSFALAALAACTLAGCSGDKGSTLSCPRPDGTGCDSLSEVYEQTAAAPESQAAPAPQPEGAPLRQVHVIPVPIVPALVPPEVMRVWIAPWEDDAGDLHDQQFVYLVLRLPSWSFGGKTP